MKRLSNWLQRIRHDSKESEINRFTDLHDQFPHQRSGGNDMLCEGTI